MVCEPDFKTGKYNFTVLILVLMEYGLRAYDSNGSCTGLREVLILVLMEYGLRDRIAEISKSQRVCKS